VKTISVLPPSKRKISEPVQESAIRLRAYELYTQRGKVAGSELRDWFAAEAELLRGQPKI
jgi:hypothetical protein